MSGKGREALHNDRKWLRGRPGCLKVVCIPS